MCIRDRAGTVVSRTLAEDIDNAGVTTAWVALEDDKETKVISNGMVHGGGDQQQQGKQQRKQAEQKAFASVHPRAPPKN